VFQQNRGKFRRENPDKTLVESVSAIFDTPYRRYDDREFQRFFREFSRFCGIRWGRSSLAFAVGKRSVKGDKTVGQV
jgi:hypothetical protein